MGRILLFTIVLIPAALLASCIGGPPTELPGGEVIRRAIINTVTLDSELWRHCGMLG